MGFTITRRTTLPPLEAWRRLTDWERHSGLIPFTIVRRLPGPVEGAGSGFTARTAFGPVRFDDPMEVTFWQPPTESTDGICRIVKRGNVVVGWAVLTVSPLPTSGTSVTWREDANVRLTGPLLSRPTAVIGKAVFSRLVDGLLAG